MSHPSHDAPDPAGKREAALREVLDLISRSRENEAPVFDAIVRSAARLCQAPMVWLVICNDAQTEMTVAGYHGLSRRQIKTGDIFELAREAETITSLGRAILEARTLQDEDLALTPAYLKGAWDTRKLVEDEEMRTRVSIPLVSGGRGIGAIILSRREVVPFTPDQIALVETFAAQAVIAIENVRQFRELQTRLEREKASAEILSVISQSRDDDRPVFEVIAQSASRLCGAANCTFWRVENGMVHYCASHGFSPTDFADDSLTPSGDSAPLRDNTLIGMAVKTRSVARIEDGTAEGYRDHVWVRAHGLRQLVGVPILVGDDVWGSINLMWRADQTPRDEDIQLVESFAAQASIAIENVRQFRAIKTANAELETRLAREAATREILEVISQSRDDERPVFDAVLRKAAELCGAPLAGLNIISEDRSHAVMVAHWGDTLRALEPGKTVWPLDANPVPSIAMREGRIVQEHDLADTHDYRAGDPIRRLAVDEEGIRTIVVVPLFSGGRTVGSIALYRREVAPFTPDQIALVETFAAQAVIAIENVRQFRELQTRLAREAATREILEVISQSRDDEKPVFDVVLRKAAELCHASMAGLNIISEDRSHAMMVAEWGDHVTDLLPVGITVWPMESDHAPSACMREGRIVHIHDLKDTDLYRSGDLIRITAVDAEGIRTFLAVPLFSGGRTVSCITVYRREVRPFTPDEVALVETFAAQAVIAIENVRQFRELQTRLAREAATREILEVISQSRDDDAPVFNAVLRNANRLCGTSMAYLVLGRPDDTHMTIAAYVNPYLPPEDSVDQIMAFANQTGMRMDAAEHFSARAILSGEVVQIADIAASHGYLSGEPTVRILVEDVGVRTVLSVPLFDAKGAIGAISLQRREERPFSDDEITLIQSFAAQAVIAIENVRQFRELQVRLAREAATREILEVISHSRDDDRPVFDAILRNATRLCGADSAALLLGTPDGPHLTLAALWQWDSITREELDAFIADINRVPMPMDPALHISARAICTAGIVHIPDLSQTDSYLSGEASFRFMVEDQGVRTTLSVPIFGARGPIGCISVHRNTVRSYADDEIALIQSFAAQAVIAIENVHQFRDLEDSLEQQEATSDILRVISQSREDETQVFDLILEKAAVLCNADQGSLMIVNEARTHVRHMADRGHDRTAYHPGAEYSLDLPLSIVPTIRTAKVVHIEDYSQSDAYRERDPIAVNLVETEGHRTRLIVPLLQNGTAIGCITQSRRTVRPFTADEIALVETFAAQAVIAIENVRQFRELQDRLAREKASAEILEVISQSREDDGPVFDAILRNAARLCKAPIASLMLVNAAGTHLVQAALHGETMRTLMAGDSWPMDPLPGPVARSIRLARILHIHDLAMTDEYRNGHPVYVRLVNEDGVHTDLSVPLVRDGVGFGAIVLSRRDVDPFDDADIALVETFAAQAVIAIENVRQFRALEALNAELGDRVQDQVGEIERMGRLKRFLPAAVADAVVSSGSEKMLKSHRALLGVLFCDIRGFTAFCETAEPEETIEVLQTYHEEMGKLIEAHGAGVDHRMGDGIMVLFNDPLPCDDPAGDAVRLALAMRDRMAALCKGWKKLGHRLGFGVGVSLGYATVGMVGSGGRTDYTASGTAINLASRLSDEALDGEILLSPRARLAVEDDFAIEPRGEITLKGMREPVDVFRVTGVLA